MLHCTHLLFTTHDISISKLGGQTLQSFLLDVAQICLNFSQISGGGVATPPKGFFSATFIIFKLSTLLLNDFETLFFHPFHSLLRTNSTTLPGVEVVIQKRVWSYLYPQKTFFFISHICFMFKFSSQISFATDPMKTGGS